MLFLQIYNQDQCHIQNLGKKVFLRKKHFQSAIIIKVNGYGLIGISQRKLVSSG